LLVLPLPGWRGRAAIGGPAGVEATPTPTQQPLVAAIGGPAGVEATPTPTQQPLVAAEGEPAMAGVAEVAGGPDASSAAAVLRGVGSVTVAWMVGALSCVISMVLRVALLG
jgi:hypothetical protein